MFYILLFLFLLLVSLIFLYFFLTKYYYKKIVCDENKLDIGAKFDINTLKNEVNDFETELYTYYERGHIKNLIQTHEHYILNSNKKNLNNNSIGGPELEQYKDLAKQVNTLIALYESTAAAAEKGNIVNKISALRSKLTKYRQSLQLHSTEHDNYNITLESRTEYNKRGLIIILSIILLILILLLVSTYIYTQQQEKLRLELEKSKISIIADKLTELNKLSGLDNNNSTITVIVVIILTTLCLCFCRKSGKDAFIDYEYGIEKQDDRDSDSRMGRYVHHRTYSGSDIFSTYRITPSS